MFDLSLAKADLRRQVREKFRAVSSEELRHWSDLLVEQLQARTDLWSQPGIVALFGGLRNEPDLITDFLPWLRGRHWRAVLFSVEGVGLHPYEVTGLEDLLRGPLGVWEPVPAIGRAVAVEDLSLILVPGLAFNPENGTRLGRGGGFYDRFLARPEITAKRLGICFEAQLRTGIASEAHDTKLSQVLTERGTVFCGKNE